MSFSISSRISSFSLDNKKSKKTVPIKKDPIIPIKNIPIDEKSFISSTKETLPLKQEPIPIPIPIPINKENPLITLPLKQESIILTKQNIETKEIKQDPLIETSLPIKQDPLIIETSLPIKQEPLIETPLPIKQEPLPIIRSTIEIIKEPINVNLETPLTIKENPIIINNLKYPLHIRNILKNNEIILFTGVMNMNIVTQHDNIISGPLELDRNDKGYNLYKSVNSIIYDSHTLENKPYILLEEDNYIISYDKEDLEKALRIGDISYKNVNIIDKNSGEIAESSKILLTSTRGSGIFKEINTIVIDYKDISKRQLYFCK